MSRVKRALASNGKTPALQAGDAGSIPAGSTDGSEAETLDLSNVDGVAFSQGPVEAAKARWRTRALAEARLAERLLAPAGDLDGCPMPPTDWDDGE